MMNSSACNVATIWCSAGPVSVLRMSGVIALTLGAIHAPAYDNRPPNLDENQMAIAVPAGSKVHFQAYAIGFQIYRWNASTGSWGNSVPDAVLFDADGNQVGTHYGGPTWESNSGSWARAAVVNRVTADPSAIPWLLLQTVDTAGPGIFKPTTYIQRVNTVGGKAPFGPGEFDGQIAEMPYTAEYFFYREE